MALPKIAVPTFILTLPSSGNVIEFRPFLVKEEKLLLIASESKDNAQMLRAMISVIDACVITEGFRTDRLPYFDAEYLFLNLRAKSVGEKVKMFYHHSQGVNMAGVPCEVSTEVEIDIEDVKVDMSDKASDKVMLNDTLGVQLRYPSIFDVIPNGKEEQTDEIDLVSRCVVHAYDNDEIYESDTPDEAKKFIESLSSSQFAKIAEFFKTAPTLAHTFTYKCTGCGQEDQVTLKGIADFF